MPRGSFGGAIYLMNYYALDDPNVMLTNQGYPADPKKRKTYPSHADVVVEASGGLVRTSGGNLGTGSPIGDAPPVLLALDTVLVLTSVDGEREVPLAEYFTGYRQSVRRSNELIRAVRIPLPLASVTGFHKIAKRRFDDISRVAVAFALDIDEGVVREARIGIGGVAATPLRASATEQALTDQPWTASTVEAAADVMAAEGTPLDDHRASSAYRSAMLRQALLKLYATHSTPSEVGA